MRYTGEVRFRFVGPQKECVKYISEARKVLGVLYHKDRVLGGLDIAFQRVVLADGTIISALASDPIPVVTIAAAADSPKEPEKQPLLLRLRWEPEGILLTPTTLAQPGGWGLPSRSREATGEKLPMYTPGGALPQMLLNKKQNNNYHDKPQLLSGLPDGAAQLFPAEYEPPLTRESYAADFGDPTNGFVVVAPALRAKQLSSYSEPGEEEDDNGDYIFNEGQYRTGVAVLTAGDPVFTIPQETILEPDSESWYAHRPEELLYGLTAYETVFQSTNAARVLAGEEPVTRPLRGEADLAELSVSYIGSSPTGVFAHSSPLWSPGFRTAGGRTHLVIGQDVYGFFANNTSENLLLYSSAPEDVTTEEELGEWVTQQWIDSPHHYANMIESAWTESNGFPYHPWAPLGTKGGQMYISASAGFLIDKVWEFTGNNPYGYTINEEDPPIAGIGWTQTFTTRESWLPPYSTRKKYDLGVAGTLGSSNPYGRDYYSFTRRFAVDNSIYELPEGNEPTSLEASFTNPDVEDDFQTILGTALFTRDGKRFIRVAYWKSSEQLRGPNTVDLGDRYGELVVLTLPDGLGDSPILPWREDEQAEEWVVEFRQRFEEVDGWVPECEGLVQFSSDGTKFIIELERATEGAYHSEGISRWERVNNITPSGEIPDISDITNTFAFDYKLFDIQRKPFLYDASAEGPPTFEELLPDRVPIEATVESGFAEDNSRRFFYEVLIDGQYQVWPHFRKNEDGEDVIFWVTLKIDERWRQRDTEVIDTATQYNPLDPRILENTEHWGYRRRVMEFPSGKEIVYMQQYMVHNFAVTWDAEDPPPGFEVFPGDGENYYAVIHYMDVAEEHVIWSKNTTVTYNIYNNLDPLGEDIPDDFGIGLPNNVSWTRGDTTYLLDAFTGEARVQEVIHKYLGEDDDPYRYQWMTQRHSAGTLIGVVYGIDLYAPGHANYAAFSLINFPTAPEPGWYAFTPQSMIPSAMWTDTSYLGWEGNTDESSSSSSARESFYDAMPLQNYNVTVSTRQGFRGEDSNATQRFPFGERYYGEKLSGAYHNVAPQFSRDTEMRAKFAEYKDRWIARVEVRHQNRNGLARPSPQPRATPADYANSFLMTRPADRREPDAEYSYKVSLTGVYEEPSPFTPQDSGTAVHFIANFDVDAATGIADVYDIAPFGRVG